MIKISLRQSYLRKMTLLAAFVSMTWLSSSGAQAALLLEPYVGAEYGSFKMDTVVGEGKSKTLGPRLGARVGYAIPLVFFALDYDYGLLKSTADGSGGGSKDSDLTRSSLFAEVGVKLPLVRGYVGYGFMNEWNFKDNAGDTKLKGTAIKAGVGFTGLPFVVVWLDYHLSNFNKVSSGGQEEDIGSGKPIKEASASTFMLTVSLPLEF